MGVINMAEVKVFPGSGDNSSNPFAPRDASQRVSGTSSIVSAVSAVPSTVSAVPSTVSAVPSTVSIAPSTISAVPSTVSTVPGFIQPYSQQIVSPTTTVSELPSSQKQEYEQLRYFVQSPAEKDLEELSSTWFFQREKKKRLKEKILRDYADTNDLEIPGEWEQKGFPEVEVDLLRTVVKDEDPEKAWETLIETLENKEKGLGGKKIQGKKIKQVQFFEPQDPQDPQERQERQAAKTLAQIRKPERVSTKASEKTKVKTAVNPTGKKPDGKMASRLFSGSDFDIVTETDKDPLLSLATVSKLQKKFTIEAVSTLQVWVIVLAVLTAFFLLVALILGGVALYYALRKSSAGPAGPTGPQGPAGLNGLPGPMGPPGTGLQLVFDAYSTGSPNSSVKLALGTRYTIPGLMIAQGVCYNTAGSSSSTSNCFTITPSTVLGVTAIAGSSSGGYGFYNMTTQDVTFDMDVDFHFAYTYLSPQSAQGSTLTILLQSYILTWNSTSGEYYSSTAYPSASYTFQPQPPCGQFGGMVNIAYTERFTLPAASNSSSLGANCGFDTYPPLLVIVLSTGSPSSNFLTASQPAALSVKAFV